MKSVFITGAGSGMGREGAKFFHANGWRVGAVDRNDDGLAQLSREFGPERLWTRAVDVTDKAALEGALADFCAGNPGGGLDMMWNNAGIGESGWFEDIPYEADSSTKHAVKGLTEALSVEWQRHGVRVADVLPGLIDTAILTTTTNHSGDGGPTSAEEIRSGAPKKGLFRLMPAASVAEVAWQAYNNPKRLHWYVPKGIRMIDLLKGLSPELVRGRIVKSLPALMPNQE